MFGRVLCRLRHVHSRSSAESSERSHSSTSGVDSNTQQPLASADGDRNRGGNEFQCCEMRGEAVHSIKAALRTDVE